MVSKRSGGLPGGVAPELRVGRFGAQQWHEGAGEHRGPEL